MCCHPEGPGQAGELGREFVKFNKQKHKALHLGRNSSGQQYMLGADQVESSSAEEEVLMDSQLTTNQ